MIGEQKKVGIFNLTSASLVFFLFLYTSCKKSTTPPAPPPPPPAGTAFQANTHTINTVTFNSTGILYGITVNPVIQISFSDKVDRNSVPASISYYNRSQSSSNVTFNVTYQNNDSTLLITPANNLSFLNEYIFSLTTLLKSVSGKYLTNRLDLDFYTQIDSTDKFPRITDSALLDLVQSQTFKYFWDFGHPVSGMARERNTSGDIVTTGGTGFGIMAIPVAINRNFITRTNGLARVQKIVSFLSGNAQRFHGAFSHWMNGNTGVVVPFGSNDDGADIVETSYMMMGLLTARQYFNGTDAAEINLRNDINNLWNAVEWDWFRRNGKNVLYWNWSPNYGWAVNVPVQGWNETLITYVLAASSTTHGIPKTVYDSGFARNGSMKNNNTYYGYQLPLGPAFGGPLFFEHYSFLGINPTGLSDAYANYQTQTLNHSKINYEYCKANPMSYYGYSNLCWGLTASDIPTGYTASSPTNDVGVIAPTAAISSLPYTPVESMQALKFFYYTLGDKLWGPYGFKDAFSLKDGWFASSYLAIDEGPIICMIENYRSGLLWNLFTSCPEVKAGLQSLGFSAPYL
ncbi:MAG: Ig-like domain-containing protein [Bacteroidetes bacterium]|nr:Ig-like domain-containing protein [Bacteroidota bacterium]